MALNTYLRITSEDAQGYQDTLEYRIAPLALAAAQTLPTAVEIDAVIDAIFGTTGKLSTNKVLSYEVAVRQDAPASTGGNGTAPTSEAGVLRNSIGDIPGDWLSRIPGLDKASVTWNPSNPNSFSTIGIIWDDYRDAVTAAHIAVSAPTGAYAAVSASAIAEVANAVDGRRAPMRPR